MQGPIRGEQLLQAVCDLIPHPNQADRLRRLDPTAYVTYLEAYVALRRVKTFTPELRSVLLDQLFELMDAETRQLVNERHRGDLAGAV